MAGNIEECLRTFIYHVKELGTDDDPSGDGFWREFRELRELQQTHKADNKFPAEEGKKETNIKKNRYKDILPYDSHRVTLKSSGSEGSDYINASFIEDVNAHRTYIAAQGPLPHTVNDFWRMLWEYEVEIVFMVCREEEGGRAKCHRYWTEKGEAKMFGDIEVTLESEGELFPHFVKRTLCARYKDRTQKVKQFHYTGWPDHGVPKHSQEIYKMVGIMREERRLLQIPLVIHCSAGCGRTGTICAVDYGWTLLDQGKIQHGFSMYEIIKNIRRQRQSMVQTPEQYEFVHLVVKSLCEDWLEKFQESDYVNYRNTPSPDPDEENDADDSNSDVYQEIKDVTPTPPPRTGNKKPPLSARPPGLGSEVNNNENKNSLPRALKTRSVSSTSSSSEKSPTTSRSSVSSDLGTKEPDKNRRTVDRVTSSEKAGQASVNHVDNLPISGPKTVIPLGTKAPPSHHPPPPAQAQAEAHKTAVKNMPPKAIPANHPPPGSIQHTAQGKRSSSNSEPKLEVDNEYGVIVKDHHSAKLPSTLPRTQGLIESGLKRREGNSSQVQASPTVVKNESPGLPPRNYALEDTIPDSDNHPSTVRAMGGAPNPRNRVYDDINPSGSDPAPQASSQPTSAMGHIREQFHKFVPGRGKQIPQSNTNDSNYVFRGKNLEHPNRVAKPGGPRQPKNGVFMTRL